MATYQLDEGSVLCAHVGRLCTVSGLQLVCQCRQSEIDDGPDFGRRGLAA